MTKKLSVVVPCHNEQDTVNIFYHAASKVLRTMPVDYEYWFVDDGSSDATLAEFRQLQADDPETVHYISFSRNFGKEAALYAGLQATTGDYVVVMDVDLQDPPEYLPKMLELITSGDYDCVGTRRTDRTGEAKIKSWLSDQFYKVINSISRTEIVSGARDYRMMTRKMTNAVLDLKEYNRFSKGIFGWVGFRTRWFAYENRNRVAGETKWSFWKLLVYALDGILAFTTVPLVFSSLLGILFCLIALIMILFIIVRTIAFGDPTSGWPSLACIIIFVSGVQLFCIGILGQYLAKTYIETKNRPIFLIGETNIEEDMTKEAKENEQ